MKQYNAITPLTKVVLHCKVQTFDQAPATFKNEQDFSFISGIGAEGLTPFEMALAGKPLGQCLTLSIGKNQPTAFFEHLWTPLKTVLQTEPPFDLQLEIKSVTAPTDRELVRALAEKAEADGCSCGGGCGCGC